MALIESWLEPLRDYPRWFVLPCFALAAGAVVWAVAKVLKWSVFAAAFVVLAAVTAAFAWWLWR